MLLRQDPNSVDAALGEAQIAYYQDHLLLAESLASNLVTNHPENFDAMFLLAAIERARHHEHEALELLDRAGKMSPRNAEVEGLRARLREESGVKVHTEASFVRELGRESQAALPKF
jgi:predicted Zn-dependent protease